MYLFNNHQDIKVFLNSNVKVAITIGAFDGCHLGHQALIKSAIEAASSFQGLSLAFTFDPSPKTFFTGDTNGHQLFTPSQKIQSFREIGIDLALVQNFDAKFSQISHIDFFRQILCQSLQASSIHVGADFKFGNQRLGDTAYLKAAGKTQKIAVTTINPIENNGQPISSSRIRSLLSQTGDVAIVTAMLGRPYCLEGVITQGQQLGRKIGFRTANLAVEGQLIPKTGVYCGYVLLKPEATTSYLLTVPHSVRPAVFNIGFRPTVSGNESKLSIEAHILGDIGDTDSLYQQKAAYYFCDRLRDEIRFPDIETLKQQISYDIASAKKILPIF